MGKFSVFLFLLFLPFFPFFFSFLPSFFCPFFLSLLSPGFWSRNGQNQVEAKPKTLKLSFHPQGQQTGEPRGWGRSLFISPSLLYLPPFWDHPCCRTELPLLGICDREELPVTVQFTLVVTAGTTSWESGQGSGRRAGRVPAVQRLEGGHLGYFFVSVLLKPLTKATRLHGTWGTKTLRESKFLARKTRYPCEPENRDKFQE